MLFLHKFVPVAGSVFFSICYRFNLHFLGISTTKQWSLNVGKMDIASLSSKHCSNILFNTLNKKLFAGEILHWTTKVFCYFWSDFWLCLCSFWFIRLIFFNSVFLLFTLFICVSSLHQIFVLPPFRSSNT